MAEIEDKNQNLPSPKMMYSEGYITLPVTEEQFRDFIKSLLGRPETLQKRIKGYFELSRQDIINFHFLLEQRIQQQNDAKLVQFQGKIFFDDDSSVTLNSIESFGTYNQIRPLQTKSVELNWIYLIKFQDKSTPERQEIQLGIIAEDSIPRSKFRRIPSIFRMILAEDIEIDTISFFDISIRHTGRTWGEDILSLLSEHINAILIRKESLADKISRNRQKLEWVGTAIFTLIFSLAIHSWIISRPSIDFSAVIESMIKNGATLDEKINFFLNNFDSAISQGQGNDTAVQIISYVLCLFFAFLVSSFLGGLLKRNYKSFVLLTRETEKSKSEYEESQRKNWRIFVGSVLFSLITGIAANIIVLLLSK